MTFLRRYLPQRSGESLACGLFALWFFALLYARFLTKNWLGLDDEVLLRQNSHLGLGGQSYIWGLFDVSFGRRWTPVLWTVANLVGTPDAFRFHVLVFALGGVLSFLVGWAYAELLGLIWGLVAVALFVASPMRCEVWGWQMGFVYGTLGICSVCCWLGRARPLLCCCWAFGALLCYPSAAGVALLAIWRHRRSTAGWILGFSLVALVVFQFQLRRSIGFVPLSPRWDAVLRVLPHYSLMAVWPVLNLPIFPAVSYFVLPFGWCILLFSVVEETRSAVVWLILLLPVLLASVTESFWFGARYALLPDLWATVLLVNYVRCHLPLVRLGRGLALLWCVVGALVALNLSRGWMWRGPAEIVAGVYQEGAVVGRDLRVDVMAGR